MSELERYPERRCPAPEATKESVDLGRVARLHLIVAEDPSSSVSSGEVSRFNPTAIRGANGIWNEHVLPIVEWEAAAHRVVVPIHLQHTLGLDAPVLRWSHAKRHDVLATHRQMIEQTYLADIASFLNAWVYAGPQPGSRSNWRVFVLDDDSWSMAVIERDDGGSMNFITLYSPKRRTYIPNLIGRGNYIRRK